MERLRTTKIRSALMNIFNEKKLTNIRKPGGCAHERVNFFVVASGSTQRPRGCEESRQGVVKYQYFSTPGNEKYFRRSLFRSRLDESS